MADCGPITSHPGHPLFVSINSLPGHHSGPVGLLARLKNWPKKTSPGITPRLLAEMARRRAGASCNHQYWTIKLLDFRISTSTTCEWVVQTSMHIAKIYHLLEAKMCMIQSEGFLKWRYPQTRQFQCWNHNITMCVFFSDFHSFCRNLQVISCKTGRSFTDS